MNAVIAVEGIDASGKATQTRRLAEALGATRFSFPHYDCVTGEAILEHLRRKWRCVGDLMEKNQDGTWDEKIRGMSLDPTIFQVLQVVNRLEVISSVRSAAEKGPVVFDRWWASGCVYGMLDGVNPDWIRKINLSLGVQPDVWVLIDIPVEESFRRRPERRDRYEQNRSYLEKVRAGYLRLFQEGQLPGSTSDRWHVVSGVGTEDEVFERVLKAVEGKSQWRSV